MPRWISDVDGEDERWNASWIGIWNSWKIMIMNKGPGPTLRSKPTDKGIAAVYSDVFIYGGC